MRRTDEEIGMFQTTLSVQIDVSCRDCGRLQRRHYTRASLPAVCFDCRAQLQKLATAARKIRARTLQSLKDGADAGWHRGCLPGRCFCCSALSPVVARNGISPGVRRISASGWTADINYLLW